MCETGFIAEKSKLLILPITKNNSNLETYSKMEKKKEKKKLDK